MLQLNGLFRLEIIMFAIMLIGFVVKKVGIINTEGQRQITDLVINVILPCNIISSFFITFTKEILQESIVILIVSIATQLFCALIGKLSYRKYSQEQKMVLQYGTVCSNAGFLGNPIIEGLYGSQGLLYASIYLIPLRVVMWSVGVSYFTNMPSQKMVIKKVLTHPCIIAVGIGLLIMIMPISLPATLQDTIGMVGDTTTAITMLLIGAIIADGKIKGIINRITLWYAFIRLIFIPGIMLFACIIFKVPAFVSQVAVILGAMPAGVTTAILAFKYQGDVKLATDCVVLTTLLAIGMLPLWHHILSIVF